MLNAYDLKDFEAFFFSLLNDGETAAYLLECLQSEDLVNQSTAFVLLCIAEVQKDESLWLILCGG